jgi:hypothetical protein
MTNSREEIRALVLHQVEKDALCCSFGIDELTDAILARDKALLREAQDALEFVLYSLEGLISSEFDGTSSYEPMMAELEPAHQMIAKLDIELTS